jgi:hypothetical protein
MKNLKIVLGSVLIAALLVGFSSFALKSYNPRAFTQVCYTYHGPSSDQSSDISTQSNWTGPATLSCSTTKIVLCGICFDNTRYTTLQAALNQAANDFQLGVTTDGQTINGITYFLRES